MYAAIVLQASVRRFCHDDPCNAAIILQTPVRFCRGDRCNAAIVFQIVVRFSLVDGCNTAIAWGCWVLAAMVMDATLTSSCRLL